MSDYREQGRRRLFLYASPPDDDPPDEDPRLLENGEEDPATGEVPELPLVHVGDKAFIELHPACGAPDRRNLNTEPLFVLLFQDVKINGIRHFLRIDVSSPVKNRDRLLLPKGAEVPTSKRFHVPDERWGTLRKLVAVITDHPIGSDVMGAATGKKIEPSNMDLLAYRLMQDSNTARGSTLGKTYGNFEVWQFEYVATRRKGAGP